MILDNLHPNTLRVECWHAHKEIMAHLHIALACALQLKIKPREHDRNGEVKFGVCEVHPNTHPRAAGEGHEIPLEKCLVMEPSLRLEFERIAEDGRVGVEQIRRLTDYGLKSIWQ